MSAQPNLEAPVRIDLESLVAATQSPTLLIDDKFRIAWFTPAASEIMRLIASDIGRDFRDIMPRIRGLDLAREFRSVLEDSKEREIHVARRDEDGPPRTFMLRMIPYLTQGQISGVVLTSADITELYETKQQVRIREQQQETVSTLGLKALASSSADELCSEAVRRIGQRLDADLIELAICLPDGESLWLSHGIGFPPGGPRDAIVRADEHGQAGFALRTKGPVQSRDHELERRFTVPTLLVDLEIASGISCVVRARDTAFGVLSVYSRTKRAFYEDDANFIQAVANVIANTMSRERSNTCLEMERMVAKVLGEARSFDEALHRIAETFLAQLGISRVECWSAGKDGKLTRSFSRGAPQSGEPELLASAFETRAPKWMALGRPVSNASAAELELRGVFAVPILDGENATGVLTLFTLTRMLPNDCLMSTLAAIGRSIGAFIRRVTAERRAEQLAELVSASSDAIACVRLNGAVDTWNGGAERIYDWSAQEMVGHSFITLFESQALADKFMERIARTELSTPFVARHRTKNHGVIDVSLSASPVLSTDGRMRRCVVVARDISTERRIEEKLIEADKQKDHFLAMLGHELRNPLSAVLNATELLRLSLGRDDKAHRAIEMVERQSRHMITLVEGLLDVARVARGKLKVQAEMLELTSLLKDLLADREAQAAKARINIVIELLTDSIRMVGDRTRIAQVFDNLISNAIKFTPAGGTITVSVEACADRAIVRVKDNGIGIAAEQRESIFRPFVQLHTSARGTGLGLGLALTKMLVELHGGSIEVTSEGACCGSCFEVRLPMVHTPELGQVPQPRILIVEEDDEGSLMIGRLLRLSGYEVGVVSTGEEAIEAVRASRPEVVLCELELPGKLDGFDVARAVRSDPELDATSLIAITGYCNAEHRRPMDITGFDAHLAKPVALDDLERVIHELRG